MRVGVLILMLVAACAVESGADGSLGVEQEAVTLPSSTGREPSNASERGMVERAQRDLDSVLTGTTNTVPSGCDVNPDGPFEPPAPQCCYADGTSRCCCTITRTWYTCGCGPAPHTDPGHGGVSDPFAPPTGGGL